MNRRFESITFRLFACLSFFALAGCAATPGRAVDGPPEVLILVSIDGFASYYLDDPRADLPVLRRLAREGPSARRMEVSFPSVTWTCHTTLVTGVSPARHGVISNRFFDRAAGKEIAFIVLGPPFTRVNEEVDGEDSPWSRAVAALAEISGLNDADAEYLALRDLVDSTKKGRNSRSEVPPRSPPGVSMEGPCKAHRHPGRSNPRCGECGESPRDL